MKRAGIVLRVLTVVSFAVAIPASAQDSEESEVVEEEESEVDLDEEAEVGIATANDTTVKTRSTMPAR
ncbi:MAG: hypothetical protein AAGJ56_07795, partial [Myxococcota bacterium]